MKRQIALAVRLCFLPFVSNSFAGSPLDSCLAAHGGLARWRSFNGVEYDLKWTSPNESKNNHQLFDLQRRTGVITGAGFTLGNDGKEVWIKPGIDALGGTPPRFYVGTPFYFFAMPFVFADPGAKQESLGQKSFQGKDYEAVRITFAKGTGDTPDDYYVAYIDPVTSRLRLVCYVVTYPAMRKGRAITELHPHAIVFEEWQTVDGLLVPNVAPFYSWTGNEIEGDQLGRLDFNNVHFMKEAPDASKFAKPPDAVIAPL